MSENFSPGPGVEPVPPYTTAFLSQRDLGLQIPINFVTTPGVSLTAACFASQHYEDGNAGVCLSNLLASGFRRLEVDLYWDQGRRVWSFCPVEIPNSGTNAGPASTTAPSLSSPRGASTPAAEPTTAFQLSSTGIASARQETSQATANSTVTSASPLGETLPSVSILPNTSNQPLMTISPLSCTATINLSILTTLLLDYIQKTQNTLSANLLYITVNIHAAASPSSPLSPASVPSSFPASSNLLGNLLQGNLSAYIYTPNNLKNDRSNLNGSWYEVDEMFRPVSDYYTTETIANDIVTTEDGWPSESYVEFAKSKRLLLSWGRVDPQMSGYNFSADNGILFPNGFIHNTQTDLNATSDGRLTSGCFLKNNTDNLSQVNSSWAVAADISTFPYTTALGSDLSPLLNLTSAETACGISPMLNTTLLNVTAKDNYTPYQNYSYTTIWSWAPGEPKSYHENTTDNASLYRCATTSLELSSHWLVSDCSQKYYAACRARFQPYNWTITTYPISYRFAKQACPDSHQFAAPRTALENSYLAQAMRGSRRDYDGRGVWVDFNSLDVRGCWTSGGPNATCSYRATLAQEDDLKRRIVLVPTIAAIIVLILTASTVFVKAAGNRKTNMRRRKRADNGFIYEGVPS